MADREAKIKTLAANLRSVTQSCKGGVPIDRLERDYRDLLGTQIPYHELGFQNLETMVRNMPDVIRLVRGDTGRFNVIGVADQTTAHIASLVSRQRPSKTRKLSSAKPRFRVTGSRGGHSRLPFTNFARGKYQPTWPKPTPQRRVFQPNIMRPESPQYRPTYPKAEPVIFNKPEPKIERRIESSAPIPKTSYVKKESPPLPRPSNFEVPPRFRKQQHHDDPGRLLSTALKQSSSSYSNVPVEPPIQRPTIEAPASYHPKLPELKIFVPPPIPPPTESSVFTFNYDGAGDGLRKIPSPKPKHHQQKEKQAPPPPTPPLPYDLPPREFVENYAHQKGLEISYHTKPVGKKDNKYICTLTLGSNKYPTYPDEQETPGKAEELAASYAVTDIMKEESRAKYEATVISTQEDKHMFVIRIIEIVTDRPNGIWSTGVPAAYETKYLESLPADWLNILKQDPSNTISTEIPNNLHVPKGACILRISRNSGANTPTSNSSKTSSQLNEEVTAAISRRTSNICLHNIPPIVLPEENEWAVLVTYVSSAVNLAVRLVDQAPQFEDMFENMQQFYSENSSPVENVCISNVYSACQVIDGQNNFYRVRIEDIDVNTNEVMCYFIDIGESTKLKFMDLQELDSQFEELPFQAIHISLDNLEEYTDIVNFQNLVDMLLDKTLIADIKRRQEGIVSAVMFDTSGDHDVNINATLREMTVEEALAASLPEIGNTGMGYVTNATCSGEIYLRFNRPFQSLLDLEMEKLFVKFEEAPPISVTALSTEKVYVAKYTDGLWYRAVYWPTPDAIDDEVQLFYIDHGNSSFVSFKDVKDLDAIDKFLAAVPFQALPCSLTDVPQSSLIWTEKAVAKFYDLAPENYPLIVKVDSVGTETSLPQVSLFKRNEVDSAILSINQTLFHDVELVSPTAVNGATPFGTSEVDGNASQSYANNCLVSPTVVWASTPDVGPDAIESTNDSPPPAEIPALGSLFNVYIAFVASPSNFALQPLDSSNALAQLLEDMKMFYDNEENHCDMHRCILKKDNFYAALYSDGVWYRVKVKGIVDESEQVLAAVHFIDYGDFDTITMANLQPLYRQFKVLPCQAIKASLHGVRPEYQDWLAEQCFEARELINNKSFVSEVKNKTKNNKDDFGEWTLSVILVDTSSPEKDVYVHEVFIEKGLAMSDS